MRALQEEHEVDRSDTEITLGMRSLLGIFFGLVLVCGVFFGLGYSLGRGNPGAKPTPPATSDAAKSATRTPIGPRVHDGDEEEMNSYTPGPDAREPVSVSMPEPGPSAAPKPSATVVKQLTPEPEEKPAPALRKPTPAVAASVTQPVAPKPAPASASTAPVSSTPAPATSAPAAATTSAPSMVQVAAVSRQEDAEILVGALKKRGYNAVIRNDPKDSFLHVQIGPFATRDEARAMRTKLLADGYNAILK
jgi:DedD protein